jgi:hypothetical protein
MATKKQIPVVAARVVEYQDGLKDLSIKSAQWAIKHPKEAVALCVKAINDYSKSVAQESVTQETGAIISMTVIPPATVKFIVRDNFVVDTRKDAKVRIFELSLKFRNEFGGKIEEAFAGSIIYGRDLGRKFIDNKIINELGGKERVETTLTEIYSMMEQHADGKVGDLLDNGRDNIFYVKNINGILRAVRMYWRRSGGWFMGVLAVGDSDGRHASDRVFSRNDSLVSWAV